MRDQLFLLNPNFEDPKFSVEKFYCWECALMEGILAYYPVLNNFINVQRVPWPKPRVEVIQLAGEENQSLPLLITFRDNKKTLCSGSDSIMKAMSELYGIARVHP